MYTDSIVLIGEGYGKGRSNAYHIDLVRPLLHIDGALAVTLRPFYDIPLTLSLEIPEDGSVNYAGWVWEGPTLSNDDRAEITALTDGPLTREQAATLRRMVRGSLVWEGLRVRAGRTVQHVVEEWYAEHEPEVVISDTPANWTIRELRAQRGLSQAELARRSGLSQARISAIESHENPTALQRATHEKIARGLGMGFGEYQRKVLDS